jgi:hypothetical protein
MIFALALVVLLVGSLSIASYWCFRRALREYDTGERAFFAFFGALALAGALLTLAVVTADWGAAMTEGCYRVSVQNGGYIYTPIACP